MRIGKIWQESSLHCSEDHLAKGPGDAGEIVGYNDLDDDCEGQTEAGEANKK